WECLECRRGRLCRRAGPGAELVVNAVQACGTVRLEIEPVSQSSGRLEAVDENDCIVASVPLAGRQIGQFHVPADLARAGLLRLYFRDTDPERKEGAFWAYCPGPVRPRQPTPGDLPPDIAAAGLRLGTNWCPLEERGNQRTRRAKDGAELVLGTLATAH